MENTLATVDGYTIKGIRLGASRYVPGADVYGLKIIFPDGQDWVATVDDNGLVDYEATPPAAVQAVVEGVKRQVMFN